MRDFAWWLIKKTVKEMHNKNHSARNENATKSQPPLLALNKTKPPKITPKKTASAATDCSRRQKKLELGFSATGPGAISSLSLCVFQRPDRNQEPDE